MNSNFTTFPKSIRTVLCPTLVICHLLGLIPWPEKTHHKRSTLNKIYPTLILLIHAAVYWFYFIDNPFLILKEQILDNLESYLVIGMICCSIGYSFAASLLVGTNLISGEKFSHFIEKFESIDNELTQLGVTLPYLKSFRTYLGFTLLPVGVNLSANYVVYFVNQTPFFESSNLKNLVLFFVGGLALLNNMILSSALINEIKIRYELLNAILER